MHLTHLMLKRVFLYDRVQAVRKIGSFPAKNSVGHCLTVDSFGYNVLLIFP